MLLNWIQAKVKHATWIPPLIAHTWEAVDQRWINQWMVLGQWDSHVEKKTIWINMQCYTATYTQDGWKIWT